MEYSYDANRNGHKNALFNFRISIKIMVQKNTNTITISYFFMVRIWFLDFFRQNHKNVHVTKLKASKKFDRQLFFCAWVPFQYMM